MGCRRFGTFCFWLGPHPVVDTTCIGDFVPPGLFTFQLVPNRLCPLERPGLAFQSTSSTQLKNKSCAFEFHVNNGSRINRFQRNFAT